MIYTQVSSSDLADLAIAIRYEQDGQAMLRDLRSGLREAAKPAQAAAKASIMSMPSTGLRNRGGSLRAAIAREIRTETKLGKHSAGVKIKVKKKALRGLKNPAKRLNSGRPWRHPVVPVRREGDRTVLLPRSEWTWVSQRSAKPGWFDNTMRGRRAVYEAAVRDAMNSTAERIARNT